MKHLKYVAMASLLGGVLTAACTDLGDDLDGAPDSAAALDRVAALERLAERTVPRIPESASAPSFVVDPGWPKALPNNWRISQVGGLFVDQHDNIWVYHRPRALDASSAAGLGVAGTNEAGVPVSGLGHPRPFADQRAGCCVPAPSVLKFDPQGNLLDAWGGPADPGFLEENCREEDGCDWPAREHGIFVDHNDFVYISGNGQDFFGQFPWAATFGDDSHVLKFTTDGEFIYQIGYAGMEGPDSEKIDGGPNGTPQPYLVAGHDGRSGDESPLHRGRLWKSADFDRRCRDGPVRGSLRCLRAEPSGRSRWHG